MEVALMGWFAARPGARQHQPQPDDPPDSVLVAAARTNPQTFLTLYERYVERIYRYCYARLGNREAAEDATSDTFTKALAALCRYDDRSFAAWLFRIAHNVVIDYARQRSTTALTDQLDRPDSQPDPAEIAIAATDYAAVQKALGTLSAEQRAVIELLYAGWTDDELAEQLGRSTAAVKQLRYRAMQHLRTILTRPDQHPEEGHHA